MRISISGFRDVLRAWVDSDASVANSAESGAAAKFHWVRCMPFLMIHVGCLAAFYTGVSWAAFGAAVFWYAFRVFALTGFYHRYFSHRTFKTHRAWQFIFAICGMTAIQRGPLWWAAHHRRHHLHSDTEEDAHSPITNGIWWSHFGWFASRENFPTHYNAVPDLARYPELVFLNRYDWLVPIAYLAGLYAFGEWLAVAYPHLQTNGAQMFVWCGLISTVAVYHATFCVNSLCHLFGKRPYKGDDESRNNWLVALFTFGEGWHNNHHRYPASARQGFVWWQLDITYLILLTMEKLRIIHSLKTVPQSVVDEANTGKS